MKDYPQIEMPSADQLAENGNRLINEEMNYNKNEQRDEHEGYTITLMRSK
jgi:hypothetical protein